MDIKARAKSVVSLQYTGTSTFYIRDCEGVLHKSNHFDEMQHMAKRVIVLAEALEYYADKDMYEQNQMQFDTGDMLSKIQCDSGNIASDALKKAGEV